MNFKSFDVLDVSQVILKKHSKTVVRYQMLYSAPSNSMVRVIVVRIVLVTLLIVLSHCPGKFAT